MIEVTERAKVKLQSLLTDNTDNPEACLRLIINEQGQLGLGVDVETPNDEVVEHQGTNLLLLEQELANKLEGITIDVTDTEEGERLIVENK